MISFEKLLTKAAKYCAFQERCSSDLEEKLKLWGAAKDDAQKVIDQMIHENYIDHQRFASAFVRGKFNNNKWGKNKISMELKMRKIDEEMIAIALKEIDQSEYLNTLEKLAKNKDQQLKTNDTAKKKQKIFRYLNGKGYEEDLINKTIENINS
ncbi:MAG: regulatory protein RecX [Bacteroidota bacterium]